MTCGRNGAWPRAREATRAGQRLRRDTIAPIALTPRSARGRAVVLGLLAFLGFGVLGLAACGTGDASRDAGSVDAHDHHHDHTPLPTGPLDASRPDASDGTSRDDGGAPGDGASAGDGDAGAGYVWHLPPGFPTPRVPTDNPMSDVKVELGRHLFYDRRLSGNETQSCASCHDQRRAFSDGLAVSVGSTGEATPRNSMSLGNVAYFATLTWANPLLLTLEQQANVPLFGREPVELGLAGRDDELLARLRAEPRYAALFPRAFPDDDDPFRVARVVQAISAFERTLVSGDSAYDRLVYGGDPTAMTESAKRGLALFNSERLECFHCHNGFNLSDSLDYEGRGTRELRFHNTGLYNVDGRGAYPAPNTGVHELTGRPDDMGRFRAPSLRNVAVTAPYMHDGSIATLDEVLDHYARGGRVVEGGPNAGDGARNPFKSDLLIGFELTAEERADVIAFLESLTDEEFLTSPAHADPWPSPCVHCDDGS